MNEKKTKHQEMIDVINQFEDTVVDYDTVLYGTIEGGFARMNDTYLKSIGISILVSNPVISSGVAGSLGALSNDFVFMVVKDNVMDFYVMPKMAFKYSVDYKIRLNLNYFNKIKYSKTLAWHKLKMYYIDEKNKERKIAFMFVSKPAMFKQQAQHVDKFLSILKSKGKIA